MAMTGKCVCGAVSYRIDAQKSEIGACHCSMCRRWSGGVYMGMEVKPDEIIFDGADALTTYTSSPWAERAFCSKCGANMYYRVTAPGPHHGVYHLGAGTLDDHAGLTLSGELYIDIKPDAYSFKGEHHTMTKAQVEAMFADAGG